MYRGDTVQVSLTLDDFVVVPGSGKLSQNSVRSDTDKVFIGRQCLLKVETFYF